MRILFFTDTHIRGTNPRNRKDNFYETLIKKIGEVKQICDNLEVDYVLHGGDWFDRPDISPSIVRDFAVILKSFDRPIYSIAGNHDIYGHNPVTVGRTMLGLIDGIGIISLIDYQDEVILEKNGVRVQLVGKPYSYDIDGANSKEYYVIKKRPDVDYAINMVHGMLLNKPFFEGIQYTLVDDIKDTEADITLAGHYHSGFGIRNIDSKYFINPGSLVRITNTVNEMTRKPQVVFIELGNKLDIRSIELECAEDGDKVLDREQLQFCQERNLKLHYFCTEIASTGDYKKIDIQSMIEEIVANQELSNEVKNEAVKRIAAARESFASGDEE